MNHQLNIYKLLSDETRIRILLLLYQDECCVCQLSGILDAPQSRISKNLAKLRDLDLVEDTRKDKYVYYTYKKSDDLLNMNLQFLLDNPPLDGIIIRDREALKTKEQFQ